MSEDLKEEIKKLKEEMVNLKEQLESVSEKKHSPKERGMYINVGNSVQDYIQDVMQGVAEGVRGELKRSIFIGPGGVHIFGNGEPHAEEEEKVDFVKVAGIMSALGHEHRLKILNELMSGGKYINELQERLSEITTSTLSSHLNVLEDAGLVVQEKVRGRYLITIPGRTAYKTARRLARGFEESEQQ